jgi:predicted amidohydrolase YtcJ
MNRIIISLFAFVFLASCSFKKNADIIFYNGKVYTVDSDFNIVQAFAIRNGVIRETGSNENILGEYNAKEKIDLQGKAVYPGFIDAHCHFYGYATGLVKADLSGTGSFDDVIKKVVDYSATNKFEWILGRGWDQNDWEVKEFPTKEKLDSIFPHTPVYLTRIDGHAVLCNSEALRRANISAATKVDGGEILLEDGKVTGVLIDNALEIVERVIPPFSKEIIEAGLMKAQKNCFEVGLTTLDDAGLGKDSVAMIDSLQKAGKLKMRVYAMLSPSDENINYFFENGPYKTALLNIRSFKVYGDGALGSRGACLLKPYSDQPGHSGFLLHDKKYFEDIAKAVFRHDFQLNTHCIGDSANRVMLKIYAALLDGKNNKRWRIEHCQVINPKDLKYFSDYDIIPSVQPTHVTSDMYWAEARLGKERIANAYVNNDLLQESGKIAFGTDFPVENINPLYTFYAAVYRKDLHGFPADGFQPDNKIKKKDALRAMTMWAAYANFEEDEKGSIEQEKFADFVILNEDIFDIHSEDIPNVKVVATYVNGEKVYSRK